jgi:hypothetical protein
MTYKIVDLIADTKAFKNEVEKLDEALRDANRSWLEECGRRQQEKKQKGEQKNERQ